MILNDERLEVVRVNMLDGTMEVTTESLKANLQSYVSMRDQRDTCLEDIENLRERNRELERENKKLKATNENLNIRVRNIDLNGQMQHDELMVCDGEVRYWKNLYTTLTDHIRMKAEMNPSVDRYIELKNFITRLEKGE